MIRIAFLLSVMFLLLPGTSGAVPTPPWAEPADNPAGPWTELYNVPDRPSNSSVSDGGGLALMPGSGLIYAIKGNRTGDFYAYSLSTSNWTILGTVPEGPALKQVKTGAGIATDGIHSVLVVKGNNTVECYRYAADSFAWHRTRDVPIGPSGRKVKAGDMVAEPVPYGARCYFLKAIVNEFYRFVTAESSWQQLYFPPTGMPVKWDKGSFLVFDGDHTVYAHKAKHHELWAFNTLTDAWDRTPLPGMPYVGRTGRSRKSKDGGCGAFYNGCIYALKGGNTQEFWKYDTATRVWAELETLPQSGSSGARRRVKAGGDIVAANNVFYALKGSKTRELWKYTPTDCREPAADQQPATAGSSSDARRLSCAMVPNPVASGFTTLSFTRPFDHSTTGPLLVTVRSVSGQTVLSRTLDAGGEAAGAILDLRHLSTGVYLVEISSGGLTVTQKLVVQR